MPGDQDQQNHDDDCGNQKVRRTIVSMIGTDEATPAVSDINVRVMQLRVSFGECHQTELRRID
jgi:hypothetical protein